MLWWFFVCFCSFLLTIDSTIEWGQEDLKIKKKKKKKRVVLTLGQGKKCWIDVQGRRWRDVGGGGRLWRQDHPLIQAWSQHGGVLREWSWLGWGFQLGGLLLTEEINKWICINRTLQNMHQMKAEKNLSSIQPCFTLSWNVHLVVVMVISKTERYQVYVMNIWKRQIIFHEKKMCVCVCVLYYYCLLIVFSPNVILCLWLGSKHQLTNYWLSNAFDCFIISKCTLFFGKS